jgi:hypothetical protein
LSAFNWVCPFCNHAQTVVSARRHVIEKSIDVGGTVEGDVSACAIAVGCSNNDCNRLTITFSVRPHTGTQGYNSYRVSYDNPLYQRRALPPSSAKPQPNYIPSALTEDYYEACAIRDDSPKAAATLARRCIQGMIRDFCKISKNRLVDEIDTLRDTVNAGGGPSGVTIEAVDAIDHVRKIGNIGAHMEKDINLIVPVDAGEAQALIELIEMLFEEWYVAQHVRQQRLSTISKIGVGKEQQIAQIKTARLAIAQGDGSGSAADNVD